VQLERKAQQLEPAVVEEESTVAVQLARTRPREARARGRGRHIEPGRPNRNPMRLTVQPRIAAPRFGENPVDQVTRAVATS
jgi:hypothetical protein